MASSSSSLPSRSRREIKPGPEIPMLLTMQDVHVSERIWNGAPNRDLRIRRASYFRDRPEGVAIPEQIVGRLDRAGFLGIAQLAYFECESTLISALVERWRPETHTFHMPPGECTITLQDVGILTGLPIDGPAIVGNTSTRYLMQFVEPLLGFPPDPTQMHGSLISMRWLNDHFGDVNQFAHDDALLDRFTRAYILRLLGGTIFADHSSSRVSLKFLPFLANFDEYGQLSWGSAALAYLYHELCLSTNYDRTDMCGMTTVLQLWAWERFPLIAPVDPGIRQQNRPYGARWERHSYQSMRKDMDFYRHAFETMKYSQIVWEPYTEAIIASLPPICLAGINCWRAVVPLVFFNIVEWHQPDRVLRQFGLQQGIPRDPLQDERIHALTLKGKTDRNWVTFHAPYIALWNDRLNQLVVANPQLRPLKANSEYMKWYTRHTRRWITQDYCIKGRVVDKVEEMYYLSSEEGQRATQWPPSQTLEELNREFANILTMYDQEDRIIEAHVPAPNPTQEPPRPEININIPPNWVEQQGLQRGRTRVRRQEVSIRQVDARQEGMYYVPSQGLSSSPPGTYYFPPQHCYEPSQQYGGFGSHTSAGQPPVSSYVHHAGDFGESSHPHHGRDYGGSFMPHVSPDSHGPDYFGFIASGSSTHDEHGYTPSSCAGPFVTPSPYEQPMYTPEAPAAWMQSFQDSPLASPGYVGQGIDLNADLSAVFHEDAQPNPWNADVSQVPPRRNPHRDARTRTRHCILTPPQPYEPHDESDS